MTRTQPLTQCLSRWLAAGLAALVVTGCATTQPGSHPEPEGPSAATPPADDLEVGRWTRWPDSPLSPREGAATVHLSAPGTELVVVLGGYTGPPCPPTADCISRKGSFARDGAAYDLEAGRWRRIAEAPRAVGAGPSTAAIGSTLYVWTRRHFLAWDATRDTWSELTPPEGAGGYEIVADVHGAVPRLVLTGDGVAGKPDQAYDPRSETWTPLPADPLAPSFDRVITPTSEGLVLTSKPLTADGDPEDPALVRAAVLADGASSWRPLPAEGEMIGGWRWAWTGQRLVDPSPGGADGGEVNNYGKVLPYGGTLDLSTGRWGSLEDAPKEWTGGWPVEALGGRVSAVEGWLHDDGAGGQGSSWTRVVRPDGAPEQPGSAVWVDDVLVVVGGADWPGVKPGRAAPEDVWSSGVWAYRVARSG